MDEGTRSASVASSGSAGDSDSSLKENTADPGPPNSSTIAAAAAVPPPLLETAIDDLSSPTAVTLRRPTATSPNSDPGGDDSTAQLATERKIPSLIFLPTPYSKPWGPSQAVFRSVQAPATTTSPTIEKSKRASASGFCKPPIAPKPVITRAHSSAT